MGLVVLTGAGISADSGLATFRDATGYWAQFDWQRLATPEAFATHPEEVHAFYNARRAQLPTVAPNPAHRALARLEQERPATLDFLLVSQNVDNLHQRAGSDALISMHGQLDRIRCAHCGLRQSFDGDLSATTPCGQCGTAGGLRPDIVWFGEIPMGLASIEAAMDQVTHFVAIGTSGTVYPAAGLVAEAKARGARTTELNLKPSETASLFDDTHYGPAEEIVPAWVDAYLSGAAP